MKYDISESGGSFLEEVEASSAVMALHTFRYAVEDESYEDAMGYRRFVGAWRIDDETGGNVEASVMTSGGRLTATLVKQQGDTK